LKPFDRRFRWFLLAVSVFALGNSSDAFVLLRARELGVPVASLPLPLDYAARRESLLREAGSMREGFKKPTSSKAYG